MSDQSKQQLVFPCYISQVKRAAVFICEYAENNTSGTQKRSLMESARLRPCQEDKRSIFADANGQVSYPYSPHELFDGLLLAITDPEYIGFLQPNQEYTVTITRKT